MHMVQFGGIRIFYESVQVFLHAFFSTYDDDVIHYFQLQTTR